MQVEIIVPVAFFFSIAGTIVMLAYFRTRRIERTSLIAAGKDASLFNEGVKKPTISNALKYGILSIGIGLGLLIGDYLAKSTQLEEAVAYFAPVFILGGISLLVFYLLQNKLNQHNPE